MFISVKLVPQWSRLSSCWWETFSLLNIGITSVVWIFMLLLYLKLCVFDGRCASLQNWSLFCLSCCIEVSLIFFFLKNVHVPLSPAGNLIHLWFILCLDHTFNSTPIQHNTYLVSLYVYLHLNRTPTHFTFHRFLISICFYQSHMNIKDIQTHFGIHPLC